MIGRRAFIGILGGGVVLAAGGVWAATRDPAAARAPWLSPGEGESDNRRKLISYAILAPNPHNRQPWLVDLSVPDTVVVRCQSDRRLPQTDPFDRQITVGLGAFLELLSQAAAEAGLRADIDLFHEGEPQPRLDQRPVARVRLSPDPAVAKEPLFVHALDRRTNRAAFDLDKPVADAHLADIMAAATGTRVAATNDPVQVAALRADAWEAMQRELSTYATMKESLDLTRIGRAEIEANPDGISMSGAMIEAVSAAGLLSRPDMLDPSSATFRRQLEFIKPGFDTAMAFVWIVTAGNTRRDQIAAGRDYVRLNLAATRAGVAMQPFSQALQEFPEMRPHFDRLRDRLGVGRTDTVQMFARLGHAAPPPPSPRWPAATRIARA